MSTPTRKRLLPSLSFAQLARLLPFWSWRNEAPTPRATAAATSPGPAPAVPPRTPTPTAPSPRRSQPCQAEARGKAKERARWAAIFASPAASQHHAAALSLAAETSLPAGRIVEMLATMAGSGRAAYSQRAARNPTGIAASPIRPRIAAVDRMRAEVAEEAARLDGANGSRLPRGICSEERHP